MQAQICGNVEASHGDLGSRAEVSR